jgi:hypothetical protein
MNCIWHRRVSRFSLFVKRKYTCGHYRYCILTEIFYTLFIYFLNIPNLFYLVVSPLLIPRLIFCAFLQQFWPRFCTISFVCAIFIWFRESHWICYCLRNYISRLPVVSIIKRLISCKVSDDTKSLCRPTSSFFSLWLYSPFWTLAASHIGGFLNYLDIW